MDIAFYFAPGNSYPDIFVESSDLQGNKDLETAVVLSLFTNRVAESGDSFDGNNPQGWWADSFSQIPNSKIGSKLWLLNRSKSTDDIPVLAQQYCLEALQWLIEDQVASSVTAQCELIGLYTLGIQIEITMPTGTQNFKYSYAWSQL